MVLYNDMQRQGVDLNMKVFFRRYGLSIDVKNVRLWSDDGYRIRLDDIYLRGFVHALAEEKATHDRQFQGVGLSNDTNVNLTIPQACVRGDGNVVTHLVGVGERDEESLGMNGLVGKNKGIILLTQGEKVFHYISKIRVETMMLVFGIVIGHLSVIACACDADERDAIYRHRVDLAHCIAVDTLDGFGRIQRNTQAT